MMWNGNTTETKTDIFKFISFHFRLFGFRFVSFFVIFLFPFSLPLTDISISVDVNHTETSRTKQSVAAIPRSNADLHIWCYCRCCLCCCCISVFVCAGYQELHCIDIKTFWHLFLLFLWLKKEELTYTKLLVFQANSYSYRTRTIVSGCCWNTCKRTLPISSLLTPLCTH